MSLKDKQKDLPALKKERGHYDKVAIQKIVEAIEGGMPRSEIHLIYGISRTTLWCWMKDYGSASYQAGQGPMNNARKRSMIRDIREGRMTMQEAKLAYNMKSYTQIINILRRDKENGELSVDMDPKAQSDQQAQDAEKIALQKALAEAQLKIKALNTLIDVAEDQFKIPIRKKPGAKQSK